jgi:Protein of unknown function (DUF2806)
MTNNLINFGDLGRPATALIEKISDAVGGIFKPYQIIRLAKAEAEANRIQTESQIEVTDLHRRAMHRFLEEEAKKQSNMEAIIKNALPLLEDKSAPQNVADDWITNFFDKSRIVSDKDMQQLWSRLLAGEANAPGAFSKRTVNLLADLDKGDAELFMRLCGFNWMIEGLSPLVFDVQGDIYNRNDITFDTLSHLESLGLIQFNNLTGFSRVQLPKTITAFYYGRSANLTFPADVNNSLHIGRVFLARAGLQLASVCGSSPIEGFFDFVYERWAGQSLVPKRETEQVAPGNASTRSDENHETRQDES